MKNLNYFSNNRGKITEVIRAYQIIFQYFFLIFKSTKNHRFQKDLRLYFCKIMRNNEGMILNIP